MGREKLVVGSPNQQAPVERKHQGAEKIKKIVEVKSEQNKEATLGAPGWLSW